MDEYLQWIFIVTALTLIFLVFAINPLQVAIDEAIRNSAHLQGQRLASAINIVKASPDGISYRFEMPRLNCTIKIAGGLLKVTLRPIAGPDVHHTVSIIKTPTDINLVKTSPGNEFLCRGNSILTLQKSGGILYMSGV